LHQKFSESQNLPRQVPRCKRIRLQEIRPKEIRSRRLISPTYYTRRENKYPKAGAGMAIFEMENFVGSSRCAVCHEILTDSKGNDMSNAGHWRSTMMANAAAAITR
jgi:hypothetical protein